MTLGQTLKKKIFYILVCGLSSGEWGQTNDYRTRMEEQELTTRLNIELELEQPHLQ